MKRYLPRVLTTSKPCLRMQTRDIRKLSETRAQDKHISPPLPALVCMLAYSSWRHDKGLMPVQQLRRTPRLWSNASRKFKVQGPSVCKFNVGSHQHRHKAGSQRGIGDGNDVQVYDLAGGRGAVGCGAGTSTSS